jgi:hypothetical protein
MVDAVTAGKVVILFAHAFAGWALCDATVVVGMAISSIQSALIIHAVAAPVFFAAISVVYFGKFNFTSPLHTAIAFIAFVMAMDLLVVAMLINHSFEMFRSVLGTWIPFALIFSSTYLTGIWTVHRRRPGHRFAFWRSALDRRTEGRDRD